MQKTGCVRRIDDLGRVVIPREIRRTLTIREGDQLEVYINDEDMVCFKKYDLEGELKDLLNKVYFMLDEAYGNSQKTFELKNAIQKYIISKN